MSADPAECVEMRIATQAHLCSRGFDFRYLFAIWVKRADGEHVDMVSERIENVAALVAELTPPILGLSVGPREDHDAMLAEIRGDHTVH